MKKSLIGGLSALALVLTGLAGCTPTVAPTLPDSSTEDEEEITVPTVTIANILQIGDEGYESALDGEEVYLESVEVAAAYKNTMFVHQLGKDVTLEQVSLEVQSEDDLSSYGLSAVVNVQGFVALDGNRIILKDALVEEIKPSKGEPNNLAMLPVDRTTVTQATRYFNGLITIGTFQAAEDMPTFSTTEEQTIKVTFPGEDADLTNVNNPFLMDFVVPAGLSQETVDLLNSAKRYEGIKAGDCFSAITMLQYKTSKETPNSKWRFVINPGFASNTDYKGGFERTPAIYTDYQTMYNDYIAPQFGDKALAKFPSLEAKDEEGKSLIFSYVGHNNAFTEENNNTMLIDVTSYDSQASFKTLVKNIQDQNKLIDHGELTDPGLGIPYHEFVSEEVAQPVLKVMIFDFYKSYIIQITTSDPREVPESTVYDSYEELVAGYNKVVDFASLKYEINLRQKKAFETQLPDLTAAIEKGGDFKVKNYELNRVYETAYVSQGFPVLHEELMYNLEVAPEYMPKLVPWKKGDRIKLNVKGAYMTIQKPKELFGPTPETAGTAEEVSKSDIMQFACMEEIMKNGYLFKTNNHIVDSNHQGIPCFHSDVTNEAADIGLYLPTPKILFDTDGTPLVDEEGNIKVSSTEWEGSYTLSISIDLMATFFTDFTIIE